jgi:predicted ATPase
MAKGIDTLTIRGFKSIRELDQLSLRSLNVLIGANGAGKSNFVGFFGLIAAMVQKRLALTVNKLGGADVLLHLGPKVTKSIEANLKFGQNEYRFALEPTSDNRLVFSSEAAVYYLNPTEPRPKHLGSGHDESKLVDRKDDSGRTAQKGPAHYVYEAVASWTVYHVHDTSETASMRRRGSVRDYERLHADAGNLAAFLLHLRENDAAAYGLVRSTIQLVAPYFDDFLLRPKKEGQDEVVELEWKQKHTDYPFHASQLSDGTIRFICLATALLQPRPPATILIDEPELGLHPHALEMLAALLRQAASRTQVIVSTQSPSLLSQFEPEDVVVVDRHDGQSTFKRLDAASLKDWLTQFTLGELWQKNYLSGGPTHE